MDKIYEAYTNTINEAYTVNALKQNPAEAAKRLIAQLEDEGATIIHHEKAKTGGAEVHRIYSKEKGKNKVHSVIAVTDEPHDAKYKKVKAKSTWQTRNAGPRDKTIFKKGFKGNGGKL